MSSKEILHNKVNIKDKELEAIVAKYLSIGNYKTAAKIVWPWYVQNEWSDRIWNAINKHQYLCIMGHGSATKTFISSIYFLCDWISYMNETALIITSDTIPSMDRRIWADFKTLWTKSRIDLNRIASIVDSKRMIRKDINDGKNAIHAIAAESDDAQSKIQGLHTKRIRVVFDEADNPYASSIWTALSNLGTSGDLKCVSLANPVDKNSEFGMHCEPVDGWDSINPEVDFEWKSKLGWHVLRLDGLESPNLVLGEDRFPFLLTNKGVNDIRERKGENSPEWFTYVRGWYPPEGIIKNIFAGGIISKATVNKIVWYAGVTNCGACDPAFEGGDNCVVIIGKYGRLASNPERTVIETNEYIAIKRKDVTKPITHDFGDQIIEILKDRGVKPENFAIDCTGNGLGLTDYIRASYGDKIMGVKFGGSPTGKKITNEDTVNTKDRYKNFVSELWYVAREWVRLGLVYIKDCPRELRIQLEGRRYDLVANGMIQVEPKTRMKERGLSSPDYGDTLCILINLVRSNASGFLPGTFKDGSVALNSRPFEKSRFDFEQDYENHED